MNKLLITILILITVSCSKENQRLNTSDEILGKWYANTSYSNPTFWDIEITTNTYKRHLLYNITTRIISHLDDTMFIYHPEGETGTIHNSTKVRYWIENDSMWWNNRNVKSHWIRFKN